MDQNQVMELANYTKIHALFAAAGHTLGLITIFVIWVWLMKTVRRSDLDLGDRGLAIGISTGVAFLLSALFVWGICAYAPDIIAPTGGFLSDHVSKTDVFHVNR